MLSCVFSLLLLIGGVGAQRLGPTPTPILIRTPAPTIVASTYSLRPLPTGFTFVGGTTLAPVPTPSPVGTVPPTPAPTPAPEPVLSLLGSDADVGGIYPGSLVRFLLAPFPSQVGARAARRALGFPTSARPSTEAR